MQSKFFELNGNLQILCIFGLSILLLCVVEKLGELRADRRRKADAKRIDALQQEMARGDRVNSAWLDGLLNEGSLSFSPQVRALNQLHRDHQVAQLTYGHKAEEK